MNSLKHFCSLGAGIVMFFSSCDTTKPPTPLPPPPQTRGSLDCPNLDRYNSLQTSGSSAVDFSTWDNFIAANNTLRLDESFKGIYIDKDDLLQLICTQEINGATGLVIRFGMVEETTSGSVSKRKLRPYISAAKMNIALPAPGSGTNPDTSFQSLQYVGFPKFGYPPKAIRP